MSDERSSDASAETASASHWFTGSSSSFRRSRPLSVIRQKTRRRSVGHGVRVTRPLRSSRSTSRVVPGVCSIIRSPMVKVGNPTGPAPRRIRRTLYCWGVIPCGSITRANRRFTASAVLSRQSVACCSGERKLSGGFGWDAIDRVLFTAESLGKQMEPLAAERAQKTALIAGSGNQRPFARYHSRPQEYQQYACLSRL